MTLALRQIRFTPLRADGVGPPSVMTGYYIIQPTAAYDDGQGRVEPLPFQVDIDGVSATVDLAVTPGDNTWAWKVSGFFPDTGSVYTTVEIVAVPAGTYATVIDFEDLTRLNPSTLGAITAPVPSSFEARLAAAEAAIAAGVITGGAPAGTGTGGRLRVSDLFDVSATGIALGTAASATAGRTALAAAPTASPTFTGTATLPASIVIPDGSLTEADVANLPADLATLTANLAAKVGFNANGLVDATNIDPAIARTSYVDAAVAANGAALWEGVVGRPQNLYVQFICTGGVSQPRPAVPAGTIVVWVMSVPPTVGGAYMQVGDEWEQRDV